MGKKQVKNRYGVQTGDIFNWHSLHEDFGGYSFYQVVALRGETQVAVREINQKVIAFDGHCHKGVAPLPDDWASDEILVRKVLKGNGTCGASIKITSNWLGYAYLDKSEIYWGFDGGPGYSYRLQTYHPEIAGQLNSQNGSGVFAVDRPFEHINDDCRAVIRYTDGREQEVILKELMHWGEEKQKRNF